jgi:dipeptidase
MSTCYVPFYAGVTRIAEPFYTCDTTAFSEKSAWWAFNFAANWAGLKYSYMIKDIQQKQDELEHAALEGLKQTDFQAFGLYKKEPDKVRPLLTEYCETQANEVVKKWWELAWTLVARYDDGYVNAPGKMAQEVGYPEEWYSKSNWPYGPTSYEKPEKKPTE